MATQAYRNISERTRARGLRVAGIAVILLGLGAALLPAGKTIPSAMIGGLLIAAGLIETTAGTLRRQVRPFVMAAGIVTALAGLLFVLNPETHFFPTVWPIIGWLLVRSLVLAAAAVETRGSVRTWTALSAGMDFLLAALLITGLSISTIVISVFGPTRELVAAFAWSWQRASSSTACYCSKSPVANARQRLKTPTMFESTPDLSVNTVAEIVRLALAPVFLLSGIGAFLNVLASRLSRIVDRSRDIEPKLLASRGREHDRWINDLKILDRRMSLINWATGLSVTSAILTCLVVILLFGANIIRTRLGTEIAWLFIVSMAAIGAAFVAFLIETGIAARAVRVRSELLQHTVDEAD